MKRNPFIIALALLAASCSGGQAIYKDASAPIEKRVNDLLGRMTLEEKVMQLNQYAVGVADNANNIGEIYESVPPTIGSLIYVQDDAVLRNAIQKKAMTESRLGIPLIFATDVIHGFRTIYQVPLGQGCSFDPELVTAMARETAREARRSGVDWTFSPMIDVCRDPRWGRVVEGFGEDPYVNSMFSAATVRGYQGQTLASDTTVAACLKHYVGYGASEAGRDYAFSEVSRQTLWDTYLPPYEAGVKAGASTVMSSFNDLSGVPGSANRYTLTDVLRGMWGFDGAVVSDWDAVVQLVNQGYSEDLKAAAADAVNAGVDIDMMSHGYDRYLAELVKEGKVSGKTVDEAVRRVLRLKFRLGLFENPYTADYESLYFQPGALEKARKLAAESMVLLKNDGLLPIRDKKRIAVIGPGAANGDVLIGSWRCRGRADEAKTLLSAIRDEFSGIAEIRYAEGCRIQGVDTGDGNFSVGAGLTGIDGRKLTAEEMSGFSQARSVAMWSDVVILCLGEDSSWGGENASMASISLPPVQEALAMEIAGTGKPVVLALCNGRPLELVRLESVSNAIVELWQPGTMGADAFADILSGDVNPSGKLDITFPYYVGQIPVYYDRKPSARRGNQGVYKDMTSEPLYPFGHGLSYTSFSYGKASIGGASDTLRFSGRQHLTAEVDVTNTGQVSGDEVVLWYVSDPYGHIIRPVRELRHFERVSLEPGETKTVTFPIDPVADLGFVDEDGRHFVEPGEFHLYVGDNDLVLFLE